MCGCDQQMPDGAMARGGEALALVPGTPAYAAMQRRLTAEAFVDHNALGLGMARPVAIAGAIFESPNQTLARSAHQTFLATNDQIARLPRRLTPAGRQTFRPYGEYTTWLSADDLKRWRELRDQWSQFYKRGHFGGENLKTIFTYQGLANAWRMHFGWPEWNKTTANAYEEQTRRAHSHGDAIISKGASTVGDHNNQETVFAGGSAAEGKWFVATGFDPSVDVRLSYQQRGRHLHAWARVTMPGGPPVMVHATTDLAEIERSLQDHPEIKAQMTAAGGADVGWFGSSAFRKLKAVAKKIGVTKVLSTVRGLSNKVINNPIINAALRATPYGQLALAIHKGVNVAEAAIRGNLKAKNAIRFLVKQYKQGNPQAGTALAFIRAGAKQLRVKGAVSGGNDAAAYLALGDLYQPGTDTRELGHDVDALMAFAGAEPFAGLRWMLSRMGLHSMDARPGELTTRDALMSGRDVLATRFA